jgi:asparagine synthase (glutamine-hydrolysing)
METLNIDEILPMLSGEFAFVLHDRERGLIHFGTDRVGRKALYFGLNTTMRDKIIVASSAADCQPLSQPLIQTASQPTTTSPLTSHKIYDVQQCKPGVLYTFDTQHKILSHVTWHTFKFQLSIVLDLQGRPSQSVTVERPYRLFMEAVERRITQHDGSRPLGFLLSGGLDSSLVLAAALHLVECARQVQHPTPRQQALLQAVRYTPQVFTIGFHEQASDVADAARFVAWLKAKYGAAAFDWHRVIKPIDEALAAIPQVISALETCDTTTVRASVPMFLLSEYIAAQTRVKVLLSGEGSDELFGGYMYFSHSPNEYATRAEIIKLLSELYLFDALRADRSTAAHGLEVRTPFLDDQFVDAVLNIRIGHCDYGQMINSDSVGAHNLEKAQNLTKPAARLIFASSGLLPDFVLWAKKEAFSDGVGHSWKTAIKEYAKQWVADQRAIGTMPSHLNNLIEGVPCDTDEALYFQTVFLNHLPRELTLKLWLPNQDWVKTGSEPSATILPSYTVAPHQPAQ